MRVAIVHYWLVGMRGGEKVVEALCELFPQADLYTHVYIKSKTSPLINSHTVYTTFINKLPGAGRHYQKYLPLMPLALEQLDLRNYDLVISSESGPAKGVIVGPDTLHICYCHSPMRYLWDMYHDYRERTGPVVKAALPFLAHYLRIWDYTSAARVDQFIANSEFVGKRIAKYYRRDAKIIFPPVNTEDYALGKGAGEDYYLLLGHLVGYKKADLAVQAFNDTERKLVVIGEGEQLGYLRKIAANNVSFLGSQPLEVVKQKLAACRGLIFPGIEDFGMVPVEAMASGRPVVAYARGGALETVVDGKTGVLFHEQTVASLRDAIQRLERQSERFVPEEIRQHSRKFDKSVFMQSMAVEIERQLAGMRTGTETR